MIDRLLYIHHCDFGINKFTAKERESLTEQKRMVTSSVFHHLDKGDVMERWGASVDGSASKDQLSFVEQPAADGEDFQSLWVQFSGPVELIEDAKTCAMLLSVPTPGRNLVAVVNDDVDHIVIRWETGNALSLSVEQDWAKPYAKRLQQLAFFLAEEYIDDCYAAYIEAGAR